MEDYNNNYDVNNSSAPVVSFGDWIITLILLCIPCVNIIMLFVWGFGDSNPNKKNYARAMLIIMLVSFVLSLIFGATVFASLMRLASSLA